MQAFSLTRNTSGHETDYILMNAEEDKECKEFYQHSIATKVISCIQLLKIYKFAHKNFLTRFRDTVVILLINV